MAGERGEVQRDSAEGPVLATQKALCVALLDQERAEATSGARRERVLGRRLAEQG